MNPHPICWCLLRTLLCWVPVVCRHCLGVAVSSKGAQPVAVLVPKCMALARGGSSHSLCSSHFLYTVCWRFTPLTFWLGSATRREVSENCLLSVSFTTAGDFPLRLCFNYIVKGLAFPECFASLLSRVQHCPKIAMLSYWANHVLLCAFAILLVCHLKT